MTGVVTMTFAVQRLIAGRWRETARFNFNPAGKLAALPRPHLRRVVDLATGGVWAWDREARRYQPTKGVEHAARD